MNTKTTSAGADDDLERNLRAALHADAAQAPVPHRDWDGPTNGTVTVLPARRRSTSTRVIAAAAAVAVVAVAAVAYGSWRGDDRLVPGDAVPPGTEYPLVDGGPATSTEMGVPSVAALTRVLRVTDQPDLVVSTVLVYSMAREPAILRCLSQQGGAGCGRQRFDQPDISITSSVDNQIADFDLWTWANVPAGTAYVTYDDGDQHLWQRPVAGVVAFPNVTGEGEIVVAHGPDGADLGRADAATRAAADSAREDTPFEQADLSQAQYESIGALTRSTMRDCLVQRGGTIPDGGDVATFPAGVDQVAVWDDCVTSTTATVRTAVEALGVRFYDARTERPTSPDSPITYWDDAGTATSVVETTIG